jgi:hypothetical protein
MGKAFKLFFVLVILACFFTYGCGSKDNPVSSYKNTNVQALANVNFVLLTKESSINPGFKLADLKMSAQASPEAIFSIRIIDIENQKESLIRKIVPVVNGAAVATFSGLPTATIIGEFELKGANVGGVAKFHGASDLVAGDNLVELAGINSNHEQDVIARLIKSYLATSEGKQKLCWNMVNRLHEDFKVIKTGSSNLLSDLQNRFENGQASATSKLGIESKEEVVNKTISNVGETISVSATSNLPGGMKLSVPSGAFDNSTSLKVTVSKFASGIQPGFTPQTGLITLDLAQQTARKPLEIEIPVSVPNGMVPVCYFFDSIDNSYYPIPIKSYDGTKVVFTAQSFNSAYGLSGQFRGNAVSAPTDGFIISWVPQTIMSETTTSGFTIEDALPTPAYPTNVSSATANAASVYMMHYYLKHRVNGKEKLSTSLNNGTANLWQDDSKALKTISTIAKKHLAGFNANISALFTRIPETDLISAVQIKDAMKLTQRPVFVAAFDSTGSKSQIFIAYKAVANDIWLIDPNNPDTAKILSLSGASFNSIESAVNRQKLDANEKVAYSKFAIIPTNDLFNWRNIENSASSLDSSSANEMFSEFDIQYLTDSGIQTATSSVSVEEATFNIVAVAKHKGKDTIDSQATVSVFYNGTWYSNVGDVTKGGVTKSCIVVPLVAGEQDLGVWFAYSGSIWVNYQVVSVKATDTEPPTAATNLVFSTSGDENISGYVNKGNYNFKLEANILAGQAAGGYAELLIDGNSFATAIKDTSIAEADTKVILDAGLDDFATVRSLIPEGTHEISVKLVDKAGNAIVSTEKVALKADYTQPATPDPMTTAALLPAGKGGVGAPAGYINIDGLTNGISLYPNITLPTSGMLLRANLDGTYYYAVDAAVSQDGLTPVFGQALAGVSFTGSGIVGSVDATTGKIIPNLGNSNITKIRIQLREKSGNWSAQTIVNVQTDSTKPVVAAPISVAQTLKAGDNSTSTVSYTDASGNGTIYFVKRGETVETKAQIDALITAKKAFIAKSNASSDVAYGVTITAGLVDGEYDLVAIDFAGNMSDKVSGWLTVDNTAPANQNQVFTSSVAKRGGVTISINSSADNGGQATDDIWIAPDNTSGFVEGSNMTKAADSATSILVPADEGTYYVYVIDEIGNVSVKSTATIVVDNTIPAAPTLPASSTMVLANDGGSKAPAGYVNKIGKSGFSLRPGIQLNSGETLEVNVTDGSTTISMTATASADAVTPVFGATTANVTYNGDGDSNTGALNGTSFNDGSVSVKARISDAAGNTSEWSAIKTVTFDTINPEVNAVAVYVDNSFAEVTFSENLYSSSGGAVALGCFSSSYTVNGDSVTVVSLSSVKKVEASPKAAADAQNLTGGENSARFYLSLTGSPCIGNGNLAISFNSDSVYDYAGNPGLNTSSAADNMNDGRNIIVINEFMANSVAVGDSSGEWVELYNNTASAINLKSWNIGDGSNNHNIVSELIIPAHDYVSLAVSENPGFEEDYSYLGDISLSNNGTTITIKDSFGGIADDFTYDNTLTLNGKSAQLKPSSQNTTDNDDNANWATTGTTDQGNGDFGTPGAANIIP